MRYLYDPPTILKRLFPGFVWNSRRDKVLLTFDDGPTAESTERILRKLGSFDIKALFFCVGSNVKKYRSLTAEILSEGHEIGNHTLNHSTLAGFNSRKKKLEIGEFNKIMMEYFGRETEFFRPPRGIFGINTDKMLINEGLTNVMWSLLTYDYKNDLNIVKFAVENYLSPDSLVVLHDNRRCGGIIEDSIEIVYDQVQLRNYNIGTPLECLKR